ncbi:unnamed protein product [Bursaphelenchus okinawaensis]|uniref:Uncharacterized protein n=1 Tax=Bursaphelenchus okinawaensis TaxID=465554 RepID=A0A811KXM1_9BILA|nr:unnamed protein product [Bursaphelenchus okinawaensis]CAG9113494.1 unnamed protein product [Bursaphelenchus okinawaensis]
MLEKNATVNVIKEMLSTNNNNNSNDNNNNKKSYALRAVDAKDSCSNVNDKVQGYEKAYGNALGNYGNKSYSISNDNVEKSYVSVEDGTSRKFINQTDFFALKSNVTSNYVEYNQGTINHNIINDNFYTPDIEAMNTQSVYDQIYDIQQDMAFNDGPNNNFSTPEQWQSMEMACSTSVPSFHFSQ